MKRKAIVGISIFIHLFLSISGFSQDSLFHYLEIASRNNPLVLQRFTEYQAALQKVPQAGSLSDPELNVGVFLSPMELVGGKQVADIRLMQMFPWFGVLRNAKDEMNLMANAKFESFRDAKYQLYYDVQQTWQQLLKIQEEIRISEKNLQILQTLEKLSLVKFRTASTGGGSYSSGSASNMNSGTSTTTGSSGGMNSMGVGGNTSASTGSSQIPGGGAMGGTTSGSTGLVDLYRIQIEISDLENNISLLKNRLTTATARFNAYLNRPPSAMVILKDSITRDTLGLDISSISDSMLTNNPMLGMLKYEQQSLDARKKMVTRMGYPMVGLGLNYSLVNKNEMSTSSMNGKDMIMPMVTVTLPVYRKKYKAMQTEADLLKTASEQGYQNTANSLQTEFREALELYQDAERRINLYEKQSMLAEKSLSIVTKSFSASGSGLSDVLRIRQQTLDYELKHIEAVTDFNTAVAWIKRLAANLDVGEK